MHKIINEASQEALFTWTPLDVRVAWKFDEREKTFY